MPRLIAPLLAILVLALAWATGAYAADASASSSAAASPTAGQIDAYLASKSSPMTGQGAAFVASGGRWQLDPRLLVAIAGAESSFGQITCAPFNGWGWGCPNGPYEFESWADGIDTVAEGLRTNYLSEGRTTVALINLKYAPIGAANDPTGLNNHWTVNVSRFLIEQGGDPNDVDMDGIAGTIPLGPIGGTVVDSFSFEEAAAADADGASGDDAPVLEVAAGTPRPLVVTVRNTGAASWRTSDVRLRRIDDEPRVVGAPYGALANPERVEPGADARFVVQLAASGSSDGSASTIWRLEGPSGPFGSEIERTVAFSVPAFVASDPRVDVTAVNGGVAGAGTSAWNVIVHVRNAGSQTWTREGDAGVHLGLVDNSGQPVAKEGWINERVATRMLERTAAPGEEASFAFRVRGNGSALAMRPFRTDGWATGDAAIVTLGGVAPALVEQLQARVVADS
jgi:hypothetical protein